MGAIDRDYWRPHHRAGSGPREAGRLTPVVKWLLVANLAVFFADVFFFPARDGGFGLLGAWGGLSVRGLVWEGRWWELLSFQFVHAGLGHLAVNMIGLVLFGHFLERWWGAGRFLAYYLLCGVGGGLLCVGLCLLGALQRRRRGRTFGRAHRRLPPDAVAGAAQLGGRAAAGGGNHRAADLRPTRRHPATRGRG
ncbi:MAG: rhomboid family intramembrane serine protease [Akkermansiaceae bacterium]|nr:rhomboid family intramembrane serine protease [Akkermansiaceae bacterium]